MVKVVNRGFSMNKGSREEPSITRVAQAAGVSLGTVSRVMNGAKSVNPDLRARVQCAAREIGFVHRTPTRRLGIVVGRVRDPGLHRAVEPEPRGPEGDRPDRS